MPSAAKHAAGDFITALVELEGGPCVAAALRHGFVVDSPIFLDNAETAVVVFAVPFRIAGRNDNRLARRVDVVFISHIAEAIVRADPAGETILVIGRLAVGRQRDRFGTISELVVFQTEARDAFAIGAGL